MIFMVISYHFMAIFLLYSVIFTKAGTAFSSI